jgi:putative phosphoribosyl transferase
MGAIGEDGVVVISQEMVRAAGVSAEELAGVGARERAEVERRAWRYRGGRPRQPLGGRVAVVVDDGIATGSTARAACRIARALGAARVVLAVPVAPPGWQDRIGGDADELVCVQTPRDFLAIGQFYADFSQATDDEVVACLRRAATPVPAAGASAAAAGDPPARDEEVEAIAGPVRLAGHLTVPGQATGIVVFAHGSGSSRHSPRNRYVAAVLSQAGLGTLLFDLLTPGEELDRASVFDIGLLARRLADVTGWLRGQDGAAGLPVGYFGASTGAAAALWAAAEPGAGIGAVVSRGGRPDLAGPRLGSVRAPTLLIVGGRDDVVLGLNHRAQAGLRCENHLAVVPGATHLFEEPGTLAAAAVLARDWFAGHLAPSGHLVT